MNSVSPGYTIWIEAEVWDADDWNPLDTNTDVIVTFADGQRWVATFFSYGNIQSRILEYRESGECLHGAYFWASDMVLIERADRASIETVIQSTLRDGSFLEMFRRLRDDQANLPS